MGVILGIDLGKKRVGIAIADEETKIATPHATLEIKSRNDLRDQVTALVSEFGVTRIIVGLPKTMKGEIGIAAQEVVNLVDWLKTQIETDWAFWDERLSTKEVERILMDASLDARKRRGIQDRLAAQRILQGYLDHKRSTEQ